MNNNKGAMKLPFMGVVAFSGLTYAGTVAA
jgi:hypothetical protein